jgi:amino acid adenylation domain-containing protein/non-ribosomal peptide synthase protein (TIGR01720 family)
VNSHFPLAPNSLPGWADAPEGSQPLEAAAEAPDQPDAAGQPEVVDLYELSPMQQGMLFHTLQADLAGAYFEQRHCVISGDLQRAAFRRAWQLGVDRHTILRTAFHWQEAEKPLQVVYDRACLPWHERDWQHLDSAEQQQRLAALLAEDRDLGFDLQSPPLMRCHLIQLAPQRWQFIWSHHHLLMDGWCNGILLQQVLADYDALCQSGAPASPVEQPQTATYGDYITWLQNQDESAAKAYWQRLLQGVDSQVETFPRAEPRRNLGNSTDVSPIATLGCTLEPALSQALQAFARAQRITLSTVFQGALALLLAQYGDRSEVLFGLTVAGRPAAIPGIQSTIGLFINTLPVPIRLDPDRPLVDWLRDIQSAQLERYSYSYSGLAQIQAWAGRPAGLFDCLLVVENYPVSMEDLLSRISQTLSAQLKITQPQGFAATNYPMIVTVLPGDQIQLAIEYHQDRLDQTLVQTLLDTLQIYIQQFVDTTGLETQQLRQVYVGGEWQSAQAFNLDIPPAHPLAAFEQQAERHPQQLALVDGSTHLTYGELNQQANQLAHALQSCGIQPEDRIGLCLERSPQQVIALLAVLKAGAAYVPIDAALPQERLQYLLSHSQPRLILGDRPCLDQIQPVSIPVWPLDQTDLTSYPGANPRLQATGQNLAYMIYTSGTTGQPKGVMIERAALAYFTAAAIHTYGLEPSDRVLQFASISFDAAVEEIFPTLAVGATLVLRSPQVPMAAELLHHCRAQQITVLDLPTAYWQQLVHQLQPQDLPPSLRMVIIGGEAIDATAVAAWQRLNQPQIQVWNGYGPTEATVVATVGTLQADGAIGSPLPGRMVQILDRWQRPVADGVVGELYIGGLGLARGYWQRPDLDLSDLSQADLSQADLSQADLSQPPGFTPQPFVQLEGARYYRTGDRGYRRGDGQIVYQGRQDFQVKLRGFRVELEEIAALLRQQPQVLQAAVICDNRHSAQPQILAYYTGDAEAEALQQALSRALPDYMRPAAIIPLAALPLTALGKLDRQALPRPAAAPVAQARSRTPIEASLVEIWQEVLGQAPIGIHDNFFELGGQSLVAMRLVARMQQALDLSIGFADLFTAPTIAQIAALATNSATVASGPNPPSAIPRADRSQPLPLSFEQQRLWVLQQLAPEDAAYNVSAALQLEGPLNLAALHQSFLNLLARQELLRSCIITQDGLPALSISAIEDLNLTALPVLQWPDCPDLDQKIQAAIQQVTQLPFDLSIAPLWRLRVIQQAPDRHILVLVMHHIITDGWSLDVLVQEWAVLYQAELDSPDSALADAVLPKLAVQYADYAAWQRSQVQHWQTLREYWQRQLQDVPTQLNLPYDRAAGRTGGAARAGRRSAPFTIPAALVEELQALSQAQNATVFMTLLASFGLFLHRLSGNLDSGYLDSGYLDRGASLVIGTPIANRRSPQIESLIGFFANMLPLRLDFDRAEAFSFEDCLQQVRQTCLQAYAHQDLPFEQMVDALGGDRRLEAHPIFQVAFVFDQFSAGAGLLGTGIQAAEAHAAEHALSWQPVAVEQPTAKFDLTLMIQPSTSQPAGAGLQGQWEYSTDLFEAETIEHWSQIFLQLLTEIVQDPEADITQYSLLTAIDQQLLAQWNQTAQPYDADGMIAAFQRQVQAAPQQVALVCGAEQFTYAELDRQSQQLAQYLLRLGVQAHQPVAFQLPRSAPAIVAMLAILKVGAFYLPLDAASPKQRLQTILSQSQAQWLIVESPQALRELELPVGLGGLVWQDLVDHLANQADQSGLAIPQEATSEALAYVMYTSGSTGTPKGVAVPQRGVLRLVQSCQFARLNSQTRVLQAASLAFDASTFEVWGALLNGGTLVILPQNQQPLLDLDQWLKLIGAQQVNTLWLTAGLFHQLVEELTQQQRWQDLRSVTQLLAGGDVLRSPAIKALKAACPDMCITNGYGPTENTTFTCCHGVEAVDLERPSPPIGRPIQNTQVAVLDAHLQVLPIGVPGELYIQGAGLAQGYWLRPDLTETGFIHHPDLGLMYRSGDWVKWNRRGALEYLGRCDQQVKLRGFRVELTEISQAIEQHPSIAQAYIDVDRQNFAAPVLVAYCVLSAGQEWDEALRLLLQQHIQQQLPSYMQPQHWIPLAHMPLNRNGKVDRTQLPPPEPAAVEPESSPLSQTEQQLCEIWRSVLRRDDLGRHDNFFALGGDSILAIQMVSRAQSYGLMITPAQLFQAQTIAELAALLPQGESVANAEPWSGWVPLTPIQRWFFQHYGDRPNDLKPNYFNQSVVLETAEPLDFTRLKMAWLQLLRRHDMLRSRFWQSSDAYSSSWQQEVMAAEDLPEGEDISSWEDRWQDLFHEYTDCADFSGRVNQLQAQLDLAAGKLFQVAYFHNPAGSEQPAGLDRLVIVIHHLVIDALSWRVLLEDLKDCYQRPHGPALRPRQTYRDWALHLQQLAESAAIGDSLDYWRSQAVMPLPDYRPAGSNRVGEAVTDSIQLTPAATLQLQQANAAYSTQMPEILIAAIAQGLAAWTGGGPVRLDLESHGRDLTAGVETFSLVGWFTTLFPLSLPALHRDRDAIVAVKETLRKVPDRGLSYGLLRYGAADAELADAEDSQICFNYLGQIDLDPGLGFRLLSPPDIQDQDPQLTRAYAIEITAVVRSQQLHLDFTYSPHQLPEASVQRLVTACRTALDKLIEHCINLDQVVHSPVDFDLVDLAQADLDQILAAVSFESGESGPAGSEPAGSKPAGSEIALNAGGVG